jgi:hypothetical protein
MKKRKPSIKTMKIANLLNYANTQLARTDDEANISYKQAICDMIEHVLHFTNNYEGYVYLDINNREIMSLGYFSRRYFNTLSE